MAEGSGGPWYWCVRHNRVEEGAESCRADDRMGPYESEEAAQDWRSLAEARNEHWDEQDRQWSGDEEG